MSVIKGILFGATSRDILHRVLLIALAIGSGAIPLPEDAVGSEAGLIKTIATIVGMALGLVLTGTTTGVGMNELPIRLQREVGYVKESK